MQTSLSIFENTPTKAEITCRRIIEYCREADKKPVRTCKTMSIKELLSDTYGTTEKK
jgi:hypothetical protein